MITKEQFEELREKYGDFSSFTVWESEKNIGETSMFEKDDILKALNSDYIFVALNPAERPASEKVETFKNFHSDYSHQKDFKLCHALENTKLWGSYITDLFKSFRLTDSAKLRGMLKQRPQDVEKDKESLKEEIKILTNNKKEVALIALGRTTEKYLRKLFKNEIKIIYLRHYSFWGSKEDYRKLVKKTLLIQ